MTAVISAGLVGALAACGTGTGNTGKRDVKTGPNPYSSSDPVLKVEETSPPITAAGGTYVHDDVSVAVPAGAVAKGSHITVQAGSLEGKTPGEVFGTPVGVNHSQALGKPLTLTWATDGLTAQQRHSIVLVKWDPATKTWFPQNIEPEVSGKTITAHVKSFSFWDWAANVSQAVGEWTGTRAAAPKCDGKPYPSWVENVVNTDDDSGAAAILTCFEPGDGTNITAKVTNNRTFSQQLAMVHGGQDFAEGALEDQGDYSVDAAIYETAHAIFDSKTTFIMPPLAGTSVQVARPAQPGDYSIQAQAQVNAKTIFTDIVSWGLDQVDVGQATDNPLLSSFLTALYDCGGKELLKTNDKGAKAAVQAVVGSLTDCAGKLAEPDNEFGGQFEDAVQKALRDADGAQKDNLAKSYRLLREAGEALKIITIGQVAFYISDELANALVGPLSLSLRGRGTPQKLGDWKPTCSNAKGDSNALYKNLALQDAFADTSKELWQFPDWQPDAVTAVQPLKQCSSSYRSSLASFLPGSWGDKKAAQIVADQITALNGSVSKTTRPPAQRAATAPPAGGGEASYNIGDHFSDNCSYAAPFAPQYANGGVVWTLQCAGVTRNLPFWVVQVFFSDPTTSFSVNGQVYGVPVNGTIIGKTEGFPSMLQVQAS
jgi:hypothetical protein